MSLDISRLEASLVIDQHSGTVLVLGELSSLTKTSVDLLHALGVVAARELDGEAEGGADEGGRIGVRERLGFRSDVKGEEVRRLLGESSVESADSGSVG